MLRVTVRKVGSSLVVTVPSHIAKAYNLNDGDCMECRVFIHEDMPVLRYKKLKHGEEDLIQHGE